jgi:hypothetical protein
VPPLDRRRQRVEREREPSAGSVDGAWLRHSTDPPARQIPPGFVSRKAEESFAAAGG